LLGEEMRGAEALSVKERLERLVTAASNKKASAGQARPPEAVSLDELLEGRLVQNGHGQCYEVVRQYPLDHWHGRMSLSRLKLVSPSAFSILARGGDGGDLDLTRTVFLDTETTGLSGGSGTCAFLIGCGYVEDDCFLLRQLFMRDYAEEEAMLHELASLLARFEGLVTYNGKSFDVPLLESRFVLSRLPFPLTEVPHFDLLHPARSLWKARAESCRLAQLEYLLLGFEREEDVPSELIPGLYFDYLRSRDASHIFRVFIHNGYDILSLAALTVRATEMLDEGASPEHPLDDYSLGRLFERAELAERSMHHYNRALGSGLSGAARRRSIQRLARQHKRQGDWEQALLLWEELASGEGLEAIQALEEITKVREHRQHNFAGALESCRRALARLEGDRELPVALRDRWREAFHHRRRRLERRTG
ncbi:MAG: ribonuclease H-like domain-containing protein, partial [Acidobacteriota bacterium]